ncbi:TraB/GumN family protein [Sphingorhabdus sp. SMR4y]|uniref:TraB/GumN family protein n=1 Tax=Sphingorhabdus sp. SMR4y TaxID=2584094 RepID=UPI000B5CA136|nr:TraB/GumN family protein [Sphingorhabdus sp. SMR4y]ASK87711.1 TraB family protein [Sphingorhabdus sp. SMR4y]
MHFLTIILSLLASLLLTACNNTPDHVALNTVKTGTPALWRISGTQPGQVGVAYMFGTIHILPDDVQWRTPALEAAIADSDRLVIEVLGLEDTQNAARIFSRLAISPGQAKLDDRINPALHDDLDRIIDASDISERALNRMETWAAALSLASAQTRSLGLKSSGGVEKKLTAQFEKAGKPIEALETIELQLGYFDKLPEEQQRQMLTSVLEESEDAQQAFEKLFNAWMTGDLEHIVTLSDTGILTDPRTREYLLVARNLDWVEQLDKRLQRPGTSLVAVGAAHLAGPDAVQESLAKRGYKVEKIQ